MTYTKIESSRAEPYKYFFKMGLFLGILGVSIWMYPHALILGVLPMSIHASLMMQGFMIAFSVGFLTTMIPKLLGAKGMTRIEFYVFAGLFFITFFISFLAKLEIINICYLLTFVYLIYYAVSRLKGSHANPPNSFVHIPIGILSGIVGSLIKQVDPVSTAANGLIYQGVMLQFICGIGGFLFPWFFGHEEVNRSRQRRLSWVLFHVVNGLFIFLSFFMEAYFNTVHVGRGIRALSLMIVFLVTHFAMHFPKGKPLYIQTLWSSLWAIVLGQWIMAFVPDYYIVGLHVMYIAGFTLMTFCVSIHVSYSHGNARHLLGEDIGVKYIIALLLVALGLRLFAAFTEFRNLFLGMGATCWVVAGIVWWRIAFTRIKNIN